MKHQILLADPPWKYANEQDDDAARGSAQYEKLSLEDICALPVGDVMEHDSLIFLWTTCPKLKEGISVLEAWGYRFVTVPFLWLKLNPTGSAEYYESNDRKMILLNGGMYSGMGYFTAGNAEPVLLGKRGKGVERAVKNVKQPFFAPRTEHSAKPENVHRSLELLYPDARKLELFGRGNVAGWKVLGDQAPGDGRDIREVLPRMAKRLNK